MKKGFFIVVAGLSLNIAAFAADTQPVPAASQLSPNSQSMSQASPTQGSPKLQIKQSPPTGNSHISITQTHPPGPTAAMPNSTPAATAAKRTGPVQIHHTPSMHMLQQSAFDTATKANQASKECGDLEKKIDCTKAFAKCKNDTQGNCIAELKQCCQ